jgi:hypothetical protein
MVDWMISDTSAAPFKEISAHPSDRPTGSFGLKALATAFLGPFALAALHRRVMATAYCLVLLGITLENGRSFGLWSPPIALGVLIAGNVCLAIVFIWLDWRRLALACLAVHFAVLQFGWSQSAVIAQIQITFLALLNVISLLGLTAVALQRPNLSRLGRHFRKAIVVVTSAVALSVATHFMIRYALWP